MRKEFDLTDIPGTLTPAIEQWVHDLGLDLRAGPGRLQQQALKACQRLLNVPPGICELARLADRSTDD